MKGPARHYPEIRPLDVAIRLAYVHNSRSHMSEEKTKLSGPDLTKGVELSMVPDGTMLLGHARAEPVLLVRRGDELFAIGAVCTHYGGPLSDGLLVDDTVRCPWHHACFSLRTGEPLRAPALNPVSRWRAEEVGGAVYVREKMESVSPKPRAVSGMPESIIIVGGGPAGNAAAETLRREGYPGRITMLSADESMPCDRPNLSKGYLAGTAPEEWTLLRSAKFYKEHDIDLRLRAPVTTIDTGSAHIELLDGSRHAYGALLLATGAEPVRLEVPGGNLPHVHYLRTLTDSRAIVSKALVSRQAVVIGASFIGLEVAASLRARNIDVQVVGPDTVPMERILGAEIGNFIRRLHEEHGVTFHLGTTATAIDDRSVTLKNGEQLPADFVVIGIGVRPATLLAERAGLAVDRGITVNEYLETSVPHIFAAGDIARWPDRLTGERIRIEHFVVAERQGQTAARNMLGHGEIFNAVPFFWTEQYDLAIAYVGHAEQWDKADIDGQLEARNCTITYRRGGRKLAVATIGRDLESLRAEVEFERTIASKK
jgi:NADPH-dependent 2,4-dienoyl-CoA reductase/sulfur reductase-like enzyme/nitrite reductase/ring-hydroxylating ferredoxin subunit